jgi:hypothetical protein
MYTPMGNLKHIYTNFFRKFAYTGCDVSWFVVWMQFKYQSRNTMQNHDAYVQKRTHWSNLFE